MTAHSVSPGVGLGQVALSLSAFTAIYLVLAVVEGKLLARYVLAGPGAVMPYPESEAAENSDRVPAFAY
jgi:cytochrome bd ubiquinol oxidase subunit I